MNTRRKMLNDQTTVKTDNGWIYRAYIVGTTHPIRSWRWVLERKYKTNESWGFITSKSTVTKRGAFREANRYLREIARASNRHIISVK